MGDLGCRGLASRFDILVRVKNHEEDTFQCVDVGSGSKGEDLMWVLS